MTLPRHKGMYEHISPFEEFMELFQTTRDNMFTMGTNRQFQLKLVGLLMFLILIKSALANKLPSVFNVTMSVLVAFGLVSLMVSYFNMMNKATAKVGLAAQTFNILILFMVFGLGIII